MLKLLTSLISQTDTLPDMRTLDSHTSCPADSPWSCSTTDVSDSCCYEGTNGLFLQTQFWDYAPATGPADKWTIHGLWSDKCGGGFEQFCNPSWQIRSAKQTLTQLGLTDLVDTMSTYWKNQGSRGDDDLWTHEFNKHGTCMSTVSPSCYPEGSEQYVNVGDFFQRVVDLYQQLPSYDWLAEAGITPSENTTYTVEEFSSVLEEHTNKSVYLGCDRNNAINEIWYFFKLRGSVANGEFSFIDSITTSSCTDGFYYLPKGSSGGGNGGDNGSSRPGSVSVVPSNSESAQGCLISDGSWFTSGTCATFHLTETIGGVNLRSSKGSCGIVNGALRCGRRIQPSDFELRNNTLYYGGSPEWSALASPKKQQRMTVRPGDGQVSLQLVVN